MSANFFKVNNGLALKSQTSEPTGADGEIYYNSTLGKFRKYENGAWSDLGGGGSSYTITAGENLSAGESVYISVGAADGGRTSGRVYKLDPTNDNRYLFAGTVSATVTSGNTATISVGGKVTGLTGLTAGQIVWASVSTPGGYQTSAPTTKGQWVVPVGVADSSSSMVVDDIGSIAAYKLTHFKTEDVNFVLNSQFEVAATGWSTYADAAGTSPVDGTGGSPASTFTRSTTSPLLGAASAILSKSAANRQGEGVSYDFTIDSAHQAKVLQISFDYLISSGTFSAGSTTANSDVTVWIYDVTNAVLIQPSNIKMFSNSSTISDRFQASFQTSYNSTSYRLILHIGSTSTSAYDLKIDNVAVTPSAYVFGSPVTDWQLITGVTGTQTTNTTYTTYRKRVGDEYEYRVYVAYAGAPNAASLVLTIPNTIDTAKLPAFASGIEPIAGWARFLDAGTASYTGSVTIVSSTTLRVQAVLASGTYGQDATATQTIPFTFGNTDAIEVYFRVPIVGLSSSVQMSDNADTRIVSAKASRTTTQSIPNATQTTMIFNTVASPDGHDTHGSYNTSTGEFTVYVAGLYDVSATVEFSANTTGSREATVSQTGSVTKGDTLDFKGTGTLSSGNGTILNGKTRLECRAGDILKIQVNQNSGAALNVGASGAQYNHVCFTRVTGPSAIAASEKIAARYTRTAAASASTSATVFNFDTKDYDTHGAVTTGASWKFTAPRSDFYRYSAGAAIPAPGASVTCTFASRKNGTTVHRNDSYATQPTGERAWLRVVDTVYLLAGETFEFFSQVSAGTPAFDTGVGSNTISIESI